MELTPGGQVQVPEVVMVTVVAHAPTVNNSQIAAAIAEEDMVFFYYKWRGTADCGSGGALRAKQ